MDGESFRAAVESAKATELGRLDSEELLVALTDASLDPAAVLRAAADSEHAAHTTFAEWARDADGGRCADGVADGEATGCGGRGGSGGDPADPAALFEWIAERERDHRERVLDSLAAMDEDYDLVDGGTVHEYLRARDDAVERVAAGTVGRGLVSDRTHRRIVSFFEAEGDGARAGLFRDLRAETAEELERGQAILDGRVTNAEEWERARMVAEYVVQIAYDDFADTLARLGLDVNPP